MRPPLLTSPPTVRTRFANTPAISLLATLGLTAVASDFEELGPWLGEVQRILPPDLMADIRVLSFLPAGYQHVLEEFGEIALEHAPAVQEFLSHLETLPIEYYRDAVERALDKEQPSPAAKDLLRDREALLAHLTSHEEQPDPERAAELIMHPEQLKALIIRTLKRFWELAYREEYERLQADLERSVAYHRTQTYTGPLEDVFIAVTERLPPERIKAQASQVRTACFIPLPHIGPYVSFMRTGEMLLIFYRGRIPPRRATPSPPNLFIGIKALADETRLEILNLLRNGEMYAQEIVHHLNISQAAVSRHLNLMTSAGLLRVRRDGSAKYYSLDPEGLQQVIHGLQQFLAPPTGGERHG